MHSIGDLPTRFWLVIIITGVLFGYVVGFFIFTRFVADPHPSLDRINKREFPSRVLTYLWRPMWLYDKNINQTSYWADPLGNRFYEPIKDIPIS